MSETAPKRPGDDGTRLDRAPGERYAAQPGQTAGGQAGVDARARARGRKSLVAAVLIADVGALAWFAIAMAGLDPGLIVIAAFTGWLIALALVWYGRSAALANGRTRMAIAAFLGGWVVVGGLLLDWLVSVTLLEGSLGPVGYVLARYGIVIPVLGLVAAAGVAAYRAR